jgi:hypothetical protein
MLLARNQERVKNRLIYLRIGVENGVRHKTKEEEKASKKSENAAIKSDKKGPAEKKKKQKRGI